jgi:ATP-dependent DNA helicase RecQ
MFRSGRSVPEIAQERGVLPSTIEGHLARFVPTGEVALEELVPAHKVETIRQAVLKFNETGALSPIKEYLGEEYSYGEIRAVIASM